MNSKTEDHIDELNAEIERLRRLNEQLQISISGLRKPTLVAENERLRAKLAALK